MTDYEQRMKDYYRLAAIVKTNPSENTAAYLRDHPPEEWEDYDHIWAIAMLVEDGKLFYDERTKHLIKANTTRQ